MDQFSFHFRRKQNLTAGTECDTTKNHHKKQRNFFSVRKWSYEAKVKAKNHTNTWFQYTRFEKLQCGCLFIAKTFNVAHTKTHTDTNTDIQKHTDTHRFQSGNTKKWWNLARLVLKTFNMTFVTFQHSSLYCLNTSFLEFFSPPEVYNSFFIHPPHYWNFFSPIQLPISSKHCSNIKKRRSGVTKTSASELWLPVSCRLSLKPCSLFTQH